MGLTNIYNTNSENIATNSNTITDQDFLMWGNNNASLNAAPPVMVDLSAGIPGLSSMVDFMRVERIWKVVERGDIGSIEISVPEASLASTLSPPGDYLMFISDTPTFSPTSQFRVMTLNDGQLETNFDFTGTQFITFGFAPEHIFDRSITFDGAQDYMDADDVLDLTGPFTVSAWIKRDNTGTRTIISKSDVSYTEGYEIRAISDGRINMRWRNASGTNQALTSNTSIPSNEWHHIAFIYNGTQLSIYIDGVFDTSANRSAPVNTDRHFLIAAEDERTPSSFFEGTIDEIRVWSIALSEDPVSYTHLTLPTILLV